MRVMLGFPLSTFIPRKIEFEKLSAKFAGHFTAEALKLPTVQLWQSKDKTKMHLIFSPVRQFLQSTNKTTVFYSLAPIYFKNAFVPLGTQKTITVRLE